jgi:hypothetical protein
LGRIVWKFSLQGRFFFRITSYQGFLNNQVNIYVSYVRDVIKNKSDEWKTKSEFQHLLLLKKCDFFQKLIVAFSVCFGLSRERQTERECVREVRLGLDWVELSWVVLEWGNKYKFARSTLLELHGINRGTKPLLLVWMSLWQASCRCSAACRIFCVLK